MDLNLFSKLTSTGKKVEAKHKSFKLDSTNKKEIAVCSKEVCRGFKTPIEFKIAELDTINSLDTLYRRTNKDENAGIKLSLGLGVLGELEKVSNTERIANEFGETKDTVIVFNPTNQFKAEARAALTWNINDVFKVEAASSFFVPILRGHRTAVEINGESLDEFFDLRINLDFKVSATVSEKVSIGLNITQRIDRGAPRRGVQAFDFNQGNVFLYETPQSHFFSEISFGYSF